MRIRTIKPEFWESESVASVSRDARLTLIGLWGMADDHGRGKASPKLVKAAVWPLDDDITAEVVADHLAELESAGLIVSYEVADRAYFHVPSWDKHQSASYRRGEAQHPAPPIVQESASPIQPAPLVVLEGKGREQGKDVAPRKRDAGFDSLAGVCGIAPDQMTDAEAKACGVAIAAIRKVTPAVDAKELRRRAKNYRGHMPNATLTPTALARHWGLCEKGPGVPDDDPVEYFDIEKHLASLEGGR